jgi:uncharacterized damage-inducible protein DinB
MSELNPYERYLGGREPMAVLAETRGRIGKIADVLGERRANAAPVPGKWSVREIVCHLADCEAVFGVRLRQTLSEDHHVIQPFDQEKWAANYEAYTLAEALEAFGAARSWNLALLRSLKPDVHAKPVTHPERGAMTFYSIVETMAGHDLNHLAQLEAMEERFAPTR